MKLVFAFFMAVALGAQAENWPQLRGPAGAGISSEKGLPVKWTAKDYAWQIKLPGIGHSSPDRLGRQRDCDLGLPKRCATIY